MKQIVNFRCRVLAQTTIYQNVSLCCHQSDNIVALRSNQHVSRKHFRTDSINYLFICCHMPLLPIRRRQRCITPNSTEIRNANRKFVSHPLHLFQSVVIRSKCTFRAAHKSFTLSTSTNTQQEKGAKEKITNFVQWIFSDQIELIRTSYSQQHQHQNYKIEIVQVEFTRREIIESL